MKDAPMFETPTVAPLMLSPRLVPVPNGARPSYTAYTAKNRLKCDQCMARYIDDDGRTPLARQARWRRTVRSRRQAGASMVKLQEWLLCGEHKELCVMLDTAAGRLAD